MQSVASWKEHLASFIDVEQWRRFQTAQRLAKEIREELETNRRLQHEADALASRFAALRDQHRSAFEKYEVVRDHPSLRSDSELAKEADEVRSTLESAGLELAGSEAELERRRALVVAAQRNLAGFVTRLKPAARSQWPLYLGYSAMQTFSLFLLAKNIGQPALEWVKSSGNAGLAVGTASLLAIGIALYLLRARKRRLYAATELAFAAVAAFFAVRNLQQADTVPALLQMAAAVYLVVRGLDNFAQGHRLALEQLQALQADDAAPKNASSGSATGTALAS